MLRLFIALVMCVIFTGAIARASGIAQGKFSTLSYERLQRLPPAIHRAFEAAQLLCKGDAINVRTGFLRYLKGKEGVEFIAIHFDQVECFNRDALCSPNGCLHRVFVFKGGNLREVWRGDVLEIDMSAESGIPSIDIDCSRGGSVCRHQMQWDGSRFR